MQNDSELFIYVYLFCLMNERVSSAFPCFVLDLRSVSSPLSFCTSGTCHFHCVCTVKLEFSRTAPCAVWFCKALIRGWHYCLMYAWVAFLCGISSPICISLLAYCSLLLGKKSVLISGRCWRWLWPSNGEKVYTLTSIIDLWSISHPQCTYEYTVHFFFF